MSDFLSLFNQREDEDEDEEELEEEFDEEDDEFDDDGDSQDLSNIEFLEAGELTCEEIDMIFKKVIWREAMDCIVIGISRKYGEVSIAMKPDYDQILEVYLTKDEVENLVYSLEREM